MCEEWTKTVWMIEINRSVSCQPWSVKVKYLVHKTEVVKFPAEAMNSSMKILSAGCWDEVIIMSWSVLYRVWHWGEWPERDCEQSVKNYLIKQSEVC